MYIKATVEIEMAVPTDSIAKAFEIVEQMVNGLECTRAVVVAVVEERE